MILKLGTLKELANHADSILKPVYDHIAFNVRILDENYGADRDLDEDDGGYVLLFDTKEDLELIRNEGKIDFSYHMPEWVDRIGTNEGDLLGRIAKMPVSIAIILVWIIIWILVSCNNNVLPLLGGKGISQIGNQYYRFFTAGLTHTHTHAIHLLANVCAMFWIGFPYENRIGSIRYLIIGVICAVLSQVIFLSIYRNAAESFGGSVYNYALCGFGLTMQLLVPGFSKMALGTWSGNWLIVYLIAGNIPVLSFMNVTTLMIHLIAFAVGALAALGCWRLGLR